MKRHGNLFERIVDIDNLEEAYNKAKRGKTWQRLHVRTIGLNLNKE